jgi:hypothetical protein
MGRRSQRGATPPPGVAASLPYFVSPSDSVKRVSKIGNLDFVLSNFKNISFSNNPKWKNSSVVTQHTTACCSIQVVDNTCEVPIHKYYIPQSGTTET